MKDMFFRGGFWGDVAVPLQACGGNVQRRRPQKAKPAIVSALVAYASFFG